MGFDAAQVEKLSPPEMGPVGLQLRPRVELFSLRHFLEQQKDKTSAAERLPLLPAAPKTGSANIGGVTCAYYWPR